MEQQPYQNFDFGRHWSEIEVFLNDPTFMKKLQKHLLRELYKENEYYYKNYGSKPHFETLTKFRQHMGSSMICPCELSSRDGHDTLMMEITDYLLKKEYPEFLDQYFDQVELLEDPEEEEKLQESYDRLCDQVLDQHKISWKSNPSFMGHWMIAGLCEFINQYVSFPIAKKLFPNKDWKLVIGSRHTSVVCYTDHTVFDMVYFAVDPQRLRWAIDNYYFGQHHNYLKLDPTLGGDQVMKQLSCDT